MAVECPKYQIYETVLQASVYLLLGLLAVLPSLCLDFRAFTGFKWDNLGPVQFYREGKSAHIFHSG